MYTPTHTQHARIHTYTHARTHACTQPLFKVDMVFVEDEARIGYHPPLHAFKDSVIDLLHLMVCVCVCVCVCVILRVRV